MSRNLVNAKLSVVEEEKAAADTKKDLQKPDPDPAEAKKAIEDQQVLTVEGQEGIASESTRGSHRRRSS